MSDTTEHWAAIPQIPKYEASDLGRIRHAQRLHVLSPREGTGGYFYFSVQVSPGLRKSFYVHRCVLCAFRGIPEPGMSARHLDNRKSDNRLANLEWGTMKENIHDKFRHGTMPFGEKHYAAKLTNAQVADARSMYIYGSKSRGTVGLARIFGVSKQCMYGIIRGDSRRMEEV